VEAIVSPWQLGIQFHYTPVCMLLVHGQQLYTSY